MARVVLMSVGLFLAISAFAQAAVDLVTVPTREGTQLTIYNSEDITMVREHRLLTVKEGVNRIQFSWANTLIDPTSIEFRILDKQDQVDLVDTTFPAGRNDALQWNIQSKMEGKIPVEIRYFTSGVTWSADYVGVANEDETKLALTGYVRVTNNSGELYDNAQTRLVVGNINLVEKIADLATRPAPSSFHDAAPTLRGSMTAEFNKSIVVLEGVNTYTDGTRISAGTLLLGAQKAPQIVKQGLSEYFLFTVEGREDIKDKEPKRLIALKAAEVPLESIYKLTDRAGEQQFTKFYRFKNIKLVDDKGKEKKLPAMENLGLSPLPNGMVKLYSEYKNKDLAYVGGTTTKYVPIGDRVEVNVGPDKDITIHRRVKDQKIDNVVVRQYKRRLDDQSVLYYDLTDYDETLYYEEELVSGKPQPAKVEVERHFDADVVLWGSEREPPKGWTSSDPGAYVDLHTVSGRVERVDQQHVKYFMDLPSGKKQVLQYSVTYKRRKVVPELNTERKREPL
jgi:autotransporter-associated beta strand protein